MGQFGIPPLSAQRQIISVIRSDSSDLDAGSRQGIKPHPGVSEWHALSLVPDARSARRGRRTMRSSFNALFMRGRGAHGVSDPRVTSCRSPPPPAYHIGSIIVVAKLALFSSDLLCMVLAGTGGKLVRFPWRCKGCGNSITKKGVCVCVCVCLCVRACLCVSSARITCAKATKNPTFSHTP